MVDVRTFKKIAANDNVAVALEDLFPGDVVTVEGHNITIRSAIKFGHKFALEETKVGNPIVKYGEVIGEATETIEPGDHVHIHNLRSLRARRDK